MAVDSYYIYSVLEVDFCQFLLSISKELKYSMSSRIVVLSTAIRIRVLRSKLNYDCSDRPEIMAPGRSSSLENVYANTDVWRILQ